MRERGHEEESHQLYQLLQHPVQETELQKFSWEVTFLGCFKQSQFTQELPSLMGFGSRTDIKILVPFSRKRQKKLPSHSCRIHPSPPIDQDPPRAEGPGERGTSTNFSSCPIQESRVSLLTPGVIPRFPAAVPGQVCTSPEFHGRFPAPVCCL